MKTRLLKSLLLAGCALVARAAAPASFSEFLRDESQPVTFLGVDFSQARYYGPPMTVDQGEMKTQFTKINELLVQEAKKYDIASALRRRGPVVYAINVTEAENKQLDPAQLIVPSEAAPRAPFTAQAIADAVSHYTYPASSGVALVLVVESINKNTEQEVVWPTFVDMATHQVLYTEQTSASGAGFGFRNHWARPLNSAIDDMKAHYGQWKKRFAAK